jgi:hypothetical protein
LQHRDSLGAAFLRRPYPSNFFKNLYKGWVWWILANF